MYLVFVAAATSMQISWHKLRCALAIFLISSRKHNVQCISLQNVQMYKLFEVMNASHRYSYRLMHDVGSLVMDILLVR